VCVRSFKRELLLVAVYVTTKDRVSLYSIYNYLTMTPCMSLCHGDVLLFRVIVYPQCVCKGYTYMNFIKHQLTWQLFFWNLFTYFGKRYHFNNWNIVVSSHYTFLWTLLARSLTSLSLFSSAKTTVLQWVFQSTLNLWICYSKLCTRSYLHSTPCIENMTCNSWNNNWWAVCSM